MARFFTSDLHLGHRNIACYEAGRARAAGVEPLDGPADDATQARLDTFLIDRWNGTVGADDEVWVLGDIVMGKLDTTLGLISELQGRIVLVPGNHDRAWLGNPHRGDWFDRYLDAGVDRIIDAPATIELADGTVVGVDHFPYQGDSGDQDRYLDWRPVDQGRVLLHGHVHSRWRTNGHMINVGVDVWDYTPLTENQVIEVVTSTLGDTPT